MLPNVYQGFVYLFLVLYNVVFSVCDFFSYFTSTRVNFTGKQRYIHLFSKVNKSKIVSYLLCLLPNLPVLLKLLKSDSYFQYSTDNNRVTSTRELYLDKSNNYFLVLKLLDLIEISTQSIPALFNTEDAKKCIHNLRKEQTVLKL